MSRITDEMESLLYDLHTRILLTSDEERQSELRQLYREKSEQLKKQREWEEALEEPVEDGVHYCPCKQCNN